MPQLGPERKEIKIPSHPLVAIPLNVVGIGVDDEALADAARYPMGLAALEAPPKPTGLVGRRPNPASRWSRAKPLLS